MIVFYRTFSCPHCKRFVDVHFFVGTSLGPPSFECRKCGQPFASRRLEWTAFTPLLRAWYAVVSVLYAAVVGFLLMMVTAMAFTASGASVEVTNRYSKPVLWVGGAAILVFQAVRIWMSTRRAGVNNPPPFKAGFFGCVANLQLQILLAWFLIMGIGLAISIVRLPPTPT